MFWFIQNISLVHNTAEEMEICNFNLQTIKKAVVKSY